jgi:hypothetical protein
MFNNKLVAQVEKLKDEKMELKEEIETLKLKKRLEEEEIKHNMRLAEEAGKNEIEREKIKIQEQYSRDISKFKEEQRVAMVDSLKEFHSKIEERFDKELGNLKEIYNMLTEKLPNVNFAFTKDLDSRPKRRVIEAK